MIGLDEGTVRNGECGTKDIPRIKLGRRVVFSLNAVQRWMARKAEEAEADQHREHSIVIDLFADQRSERRYIREAAKQLASKERRRWER